MTFPWRTALFVSLALNFVLIGAAVGAFATGARLQRSDLQNDAPQILGQRVFMQALPPDTRRALRRDLARELISLREERAASRAARDALYDAARAEPYDAARVREAFAAVRTADGLVFAGFHDALAEGLGRLSAEERAAALDALARGRSGATDAPRAQDQEETNQPTNAAPTRDERRERLRRWRERRAERRGEP